MLSQGPKVTYPDRAHSGGWYRYMFSGKMYLILSFESQALRATLANQYVQRSDKSSEHNWAEPYGKKKKSLEYGIFSLGSIDGVCSSLGV